MNHPATPLGTEAVGALSGLKLLVVEDDALVRDVIVRAAGDCGIDVDAVEHGDAAIALLADKDYDVVVTDLKMPGISGLELMDRLRETHPRTALIVITGFALDEVEERVSRSGGLLLHKPFNLAALLDALHWARERRAQKKP